MSDVVLSLFPGIGLLDMAFEEAGFCVVRGPDVLWGGDVRRFHPPRLVFDGIIGGPPCQAFSPLGNLVRSKGFEPAFGDLIPEFVRVVEEAGPEWFLMENVDAAPEPFPFGYSVRSFMFDNAAVDVGDGYGHEQERKRRLSFGARGVPRGVDLRRFIQPAALMLPRIPGAILQTSDTAGVRGRRVAVTAAHSGAKGRPKGGHLVVYDWPEMLRLQGLPPDFLKDSPFTVRGKRSVVANGVPLPMGRVLARAVRQWNEYEATA